MRDEEGWVGKGGIISGQPDLVAPIPSQRVEVAQKCRFLNVLLHEFVQCEECGFVSLVDEACGAHLKRVHCAAIVCDVCDKVRVFLCFLCIPLVNVHSEWDSQFIYVQDFLVIVNDDNVRLEVGDAQVGWNGASSCCFPTWQITEHFKLFFAHTVDNEIDDLHMYISVFSYVNNNS